MSRRAIHARQYSVFPRALLLGVMSILTWGTMGWASTRFGPDLEVQAWYRMRHTFQTDGDNRFDWVQWRNEAYVWLIYNNIVQNGTLRPLHLGWHIPFVENLAISARYRARVDPVYYLRDHYYDLYDSEHRANWFNPERDFRDLYADIDHGQLGPGRLSTRWGYQQIVWGESDLFRSLDIINPLRIDQNFAVGEKFDEFRFPILAVKALYDIGNIGEWFSNVGIEPFYSPRWFSGSKHLLLEDGWRIQFQIKNCLGPNGEKLDYSPENCANSRHFLPYRANWLGWERIRHPWSLFRVGPVGRIESPDFACATLRCAPDVPGDRISVIYNIMKGRGTHHTRGTGQHHAAGVRLLGTTWFGAQVSLNYIWLPVLYGDGREFPPERALRVFGDFPFSGIPPSGTFEEGLRECLSPSGKSSTRTTPAPAGLVVLTGADLRGYDWPERKLDATGKPLSRKQKQAARLPLTLCANTPKHTYRPTHVIGFTATYNDFNYTGAVWRLEQSLSTEEYMNRYPVGYGIHGTTTRPGRTLFHPQMMWRSMVGFDLFSAIMNYPGMGWTRNLPGDFGTQASFLSFQWLMQYKPAVSNTFCTWNNAVGTGPSLPAEEPPSRKAFSGCREHHWNHILTLGLSGQGYFKSKLEQRLAIAFEPRGKQYLLYGQWWWRDFFSLPVDLSMGTSWFPGSRFDNSWSLLNYFVGRNLLWFEATYYLL
jgi:hypothetical protein